MHDLCNVCTLAGPAWTFAGRPLEAQSAGKDSGSSGSNGSSYCREAGPPGPGAYDQSLCCMQDGPAFSFSMLGREPPRWGPCTEVSVYASVSITAVGHSVHVDAEHAFTIWCGCVCGDRKRRH